MDPYPFGLEGDARKCQSPVVCQTLPLSTLCMPPPFTSLPGPFRPPSVLVFSEIGDGASDDGISA